MAVRWHRVFDDALRSSDVIAVWAAVERFLGRRPTAAELSAARRAANRYAASSNARVLRVPAPLGGRGDRKVLMLARADADLSDPDRVRGIATSRPAGRRRPHQGQGTRNVPQRAEKLLANLTTAARTTHRLSVAELDPVHAAALAEDLAKVLPDLQQFHKRLRLRAELDSGTAC